MANIVEVNKKFNIRFENGAETPYEFDNVVSNLEKFILGVIRNSVTDSDRILTLKGYSRENGKLLFCMENVNNYYFDHHCAKCMLVIKKEDERYYVYFEGQRKLYGPFYSVEKVYDSVLVTKKVKINGTEVYKKGIYNHLGEYVIPIKYDDIKVYEKFAIVEKDGKYRILSSTPECKGYVLEACDEVKPIVCGGYYMYIAFRLTSNGKYGVIDEYGDEIVPPRYTSVKYLRKKNVFIVKNNDFYGIYDDDGEIIFDTIFSYLIEESEFPLIYLELFERKFYFWPEKNLLLQENAIEVCENKIKYLDGRKWKKEKIKKADNKHD